MKDVFSKILEDLPPGVRAVIAVVSAVTIFIFFNRYSGYFRNPVYLGGLIALEIMLATLWHFETAYFPLLMGCFLWAGMNLPFVGIPSTARWFALAIAAVAGFIIWMRQPQHTYGTFHLVALYCVLAGLVSAVVSAEPLTALLKVFSLLLLFLYGATGARLATLGREVAFVRGLVLACEITVFTTAAAYLGMGWPLFGNPNSVGAVMGVVITPFLMWGYLIAQTRAERHRRVLGMALACFLLYVSQSRAGILTASVAVLTICVALRRQRLLLQGLFIFLLIMALLAMWNPSHFEEQVKQTADDLLYKGKDKSAGLLQSRMTPWQETTAVIQAHPLFGSGFGTSDLGRWAERPDLSMAPSTGGLYTHEGTNREHGNSYLALAEYLGLLGVLPFLALLFLLVKMIARVIIYMRRTGNPYHCAIPLAMMLLAGMVHAFFEDWMTAVGYYLTVFFWISAFWLHDFLPVSVPVAISGISPAHPRVAMSSRSGSATGP